MCFQNKGDDERRRDAQISFFCGVQFLTPRQGMTLAIAAPDFDGPSQTFVRDHARSIAPAHTILLCNNSRGTEEFDCPILANIDPWKPPRAYRERIVRAVEHRWQTYIDPSFHSLNREKVKLFLQTHGATAVLAEYGTTGVAFTSVCEEAGIPLYVHFHGYDASMLINDPVWRRAYRRVFRVAAGVIAPSRFLAERLASLGCPEAKLHVSACGVDGDQFRPTQRLPNRILAVGRLVEKKAPHLTIEAFSRISAQHLNAKLDIVGDGPLLERCKTLIEQCRLGGRVHMHGAQPSEFVAQLMSQASLFVQHSVTAESGDSEGLPVAILEAMSSALPIVSTRHSGIPEAVLDEVTGLLVPERDIAGMAAAMNALLSEPIRAAAMGEAGRRRFLAHFTRDKARDRLRNIMGIAIQPAGQNGRLASSA
jgi:glycosyltransferase involved in cell wall biosynthesis